MPMNLVSIKGNKYGIAIVIKEEADIKAAKKEIADKIKESAKFFGNTKCAVAFEGKKLNNEEMNEIIEIISENSMLQVVCIIDNDTEELYKNVVEAQEMNTVEASSVAENAIPNITGGQFYRGTLRSGQVLESESSIVILGDVNPGAKIISGGNVVILGSLKGTVYAGLGSLETAFVVALDMHPVQIRIGDVIARCADKPKKNAKLETKIAYVDEGNIYIEPLSREVLNDIKL